MEYTILKLAKLSGVSTRALRYYDEIGLLKPGRMEASGYRVYGEKEVDLLQQILFYRALGFPLQEIKAILSSPSFHRLAALKSHLASLQERRHTLTLLIDNVQKTILKEEGILSMSDQEKFEGLKEQLLAENEAKYGKEVRETYGDSQAEQSNQKFSNLTESEFQEMKALEREILEKLSLAVRENRSPKGPAGQEIAGLHRKWLSYSWPSYSKEAHLGLAELYVQDTRFRSYYDREAPGCAEFLHGALLFWLKGNG